MIRPDLFAFVIASLRYGNTLDELSEALNACVTASRSAIGRPLYTFMPLYPVL